MHDACRTYKTNGILQKLSLCDNSDVDIVFKGTKIITGKGADAGSRQADQRNKEVIFENYVPFTDCISKINNTQIDNGKNIDVVVPIYNSIEDIDNLWEYNRDDLNRL